MEHAINKQIKKYIHTY